MTTSVYETMAIPAKRDWAGTRQALTPPRHTGAVAIIPMTRSCAVRCGGPTPSSCRRPGSRACSGRGQGRFSSLRLRGLHLASLVVDDLQARTGERGNPHQRPGRITRCGDGSAWE